MYGFYGILLTKKLLEASHHQWQQSIFGVSSREKITKHEVGRTGQPKLKTILTRNVGQCPT